MTETTIAGPSTAPERQLMPGAFNPGDYIDFHDNPWRDDHNATDDIWKPFVPLRKKTKKSLPKQPLNKSLPEEPINKSLPEESINNSLPEEPVDRSSPLWSDNNLAELNLQGVKWFSYSPPPALSQTPNVTSEILQSLVAESIELTRGQAEEKKRQEEDEAARRSSTNKQPKLSEGEEPYLPIIIPVEQPVEKPLPTPPPSESDTRPLDVRPSDELSLRRAEALMTISRSKSPARSSLSATSEKAGRLKLRQALGWTNDAEEGKGQKSGRGAFIRKLFEGSNSPHANYVFSASQAGVQNNAAKGITAVQAKPDVPLKEPVPTIECVSCLDDFPVPDTVKVPCHSYCGDCFAGLISVSVQNEQQWPPKCCLNEIPFRTIFKYIPEDLKARFKDRSEEWNTPVDQRIYCHDANCGSWIKPTRISAADQRGRCENGHKTCIICRGKSHGSKPCANDTNLTLTHQLAEEQGWKKCGKCKAYVEHAQACRHMTCRCGYQFCYVCGARWCTCNCTGDQLAVIKRQASEKAAKRRQREVAEAEDLRQALAQIAEFEREEQRKAVLLRQEQERLERERQQRELEERLRKETVRRADLEIKFLELRKGLDLLHDLQLVMLESHHEDAARLLAEEIQHANCQLDEKHRQERADAEIDMKKNIEAKDESFGEDYRERSLAEDKMIGDYRAQLEAFYASHANGAEEIEKSISPLLQRMEENQQSYNKWKAAQLEKYERKLRERQQIREEYRYSARARLQDAQDQRELELVKKSLAENQWMHLVVRRREMMLQVMELEEITGDADSLFGDFEVGEGVGRAL